MGDALRRARRLRRRARPAPRDGRAARRRRPRPRTSAFSTGSASPASPVLLGYEHSLVRPGDLRRLDAAFFTMNGVISVAFFAFVLADVAVIVGLLHPGEMGAAVGRVLQGNGHDVLWASEGRSEATRARARTLRRCADSAERRRSQAESDPLDLPAARGASRSRGAVAEFDGVFVDANAISPMRAREVAGDPAAASSTAASSAARRASPARRSISRATAPRTSRRSSPARPSQARGGRRRVGGEDGVRRVVEGHGGAAARDPRRRAATSASRRSGGARRRSSLERLRARGALGRREGLALDRRDGGDRRHVRRGRASPTASTAPRPRSTAR